MDASVILVDVAESVEGTIDTAFLEKLGHRVIVCHGPAHKTLCPILHHDGTCPLVEEAHGIVFVLDLERPQHRAILRRYQEVVREDLPIRVVTTPELTERFANLLSGVEVWPHEMTRGDLDGFAAQVEAADWAREG